MRIMKKRDEKKCGKFYPEDPKATRWEEYT
jgi:hypothetical protein